MTYPPDPPSSPYRPDAGSGYLSTDAPPALSDETSPYAAGQGTVGDSAFAPPATSESSDASDSSTTDIAKQQAGEVGDTAAQAGQHVAGVAKEQAANVAGQAKYEAKNLLGQTRTELTGQASSQQQRAASGLRSLGNELQSMSSNSEGDGPASEVARQAATRINSVASWLEDREPGQVLDEVQRFARQRPGAFLALAATAGLLAGRLTRGLTAGDSSGQTQSDGRSSTPVGGFAGQDGMAGAAAYGTGTYGTESYGTETYGTETYGTQTYGTQAPGSESYGTETYGTEPYGTPAPGTQAYGTGAGSGQSPQPAPPAAWEQDPMPPAVEEGYGQGAPGSGQVGR